MKKDRIADFIEYYRVNSGENIVPPEKALRRDLEGMEIYGPAILGVAAAEDPAFLTLKNKEAVGPHFMLPGEWLEGARSAISFFLPYSERIKKANAGPDPEPVAEWLHGRIEGQKFIDRLSEALVDFIRREGEEALSPLLDKRFASCTLENKAFLDEKEAPLPLSFTSNWSERHVAYVCGLGTFGLSRGLITKKGVAGRFGSVITTLALAPDNVIPSDLYGNCSMCGRCVALCPVGAITLEKGKDHVACSEYLELMKVRHAPRYGCGKCQVGVPCEGAIPTKNNRPQGP